MKVFSALRARMGDFWWYSVLIFLAARSGDLVQAFIGLWLVPRYVPQAELGAVLPLVQMANVWGLPLTILIVPFMKFLNTYATRGELGKVKRLLQVAFIGAVATAGVSLAIARFVMPGFFGQLRVTAGSLGVLVLAVGLLTTLSPVFVNSLQSLKRFRPIIALYVLNPPVQLAVMLIAMPFRALSGYLLGQLSAPVVSIACSLVCLRHDLGRKIKASPIWKADGRAMLLYTLPIALNMLISTSLGAWQAMLVRQRLPDVESAAFYLISRLAEVGTYAGLSLAFVVFPMAAEAQTRGERSPALLRNLLLGSLGAGLAVAAVYAVAGRGIFQLVPGGGACTGRVPLLVLFTVRQALIVTICSFGAYEMSQSRFRYLCYTIPFTFLETCPLIVLTGCDGLRGVLPDALVDGMASLNAGRLGFFIGWFFVVAVLESLAVALHLWLRHHQATFVAGADGTSALQGDAAGCR